ncbi:MAG: site-specific integrase, partial [Deltaproteobacteria bacterium]
VDKDPCMRLNAFFTAEEAGRLIHDPSILPDRRVAYVLAFLTGMRLGEIAGLRWCNVDLDMQPLGAIDVVETYDGRPTKTRTARKVPIVPQLGEILEAWFASGFERIFGRPPTPDDLVVPRPPYGRGPAGTSHSKNSLGKAFTKDLARLGLRHRRFHDARRTFISLALSSGAQRDVVERVTHTSRPRPSAFDAYITFDWPVVCREISKLVLPNPFAATNATSDEATVEPAGRGGP